VPAEIQFARVRILGAVHRPRLLRPSYYARQIHGWPRKAAEATRAMRATRGLAQGKSPQRPRFERRTRCLTEPSSAGSKIVTPRSASDDPRLKEK
jgi:hypothetical protein